MSPDRGPNDRSIRRAELSVRIEQRRKEESGVPRKRASSEPERDDTPPPSGLERWDDEALDVVPLRQKHSGRRSDRARRRFERLQASDVAPTSSGAEPLADPAIVLGIARGPCQLELADGSVVTAHLPKALAREERSEIAVGDRVLVARRASGELVVERLLPRTSRLSRPDPFLAHRERVIVANLDLAVVVISLRRPPLSTGLVDRFLVALAHGEVPAALAVNKIDLSEAIGADDPELARLAPYRALDVPLFFCSAKNGDGLADLGAAIAGKTVVFVGHSGVGKSSLLNALVPEAMAAVGDVSAGSDRGRHTTTAPRVYRAPNGTRIVDTPGVREFGLWKMSPRELAGYFAEFAEPSTQCRFTDCSHVHEPRCAVREAAESGAIPRERYETYLRVLESLEAE